MLINPISKDRVFIKKENLDCYLNAGYIIDCPNKNKKLMFRPGVDIISINVDINDIQKYLDAGYVYGNINKLLHGKCIKNDKLKLMISPEKTIVRISYKQVPIKEKQGYILLQKLYLNL